MHARSSKGVMVLTGLWCCVIVIVNLVCLSQACIVVTECHVAGLGWRVHA